MEAIKIHLPEKKLKLAPIGDIQYGAQGCDLDKLKKHIVYGMKHGWRFLGMGDYIDVFSPSNRQAMMRASADMYESPKEMIDNAAMEMVDDLFNKSLKTSVGNWLGLLEGHHFAEFGDGSSTDHYLAQLLRSSFLGSSTLIHVYLADCPVPLRIWATHGSGASVSTAGKMVHMERVGFDFNADIYAEGHIHRKFGIPLDCLEAVDAPAKKAVKNAIRGEGAEDIRVVAKTKLLAFTGSFLRGWTQGSESVAGYARGSYAEQKVMRTIPTGGLLITAEMIEEDWGWRPDIFVSA